MNTNFASRNFLCKFLCGFTAIIVAASSSLFAQAPGIEWQRCLGGTDRENSVNTSGHTIIQGTAAGYVIVSSTNSNDGDVSGNHGGMDVWVTKLSSSGTLKWQKCFGGSGNDEAYSIISTSDGGYAIAGYTTSNDGDVSGNHGGWSDGWVIKLDADGKIEWQKCLGGNNWDEVNSIQETNDGGYIVAGFTLSDEEGWFNHGNSDTYIIKLTSSGGIQWQKLYGGPGVDGGGTILQNEGGYIFACTTFSFSGEVSGNHGDSTAGVGDIWVVQLDTVGKIKWQQCYGGSSAEFATSLIHTSDGGYAISAWTESKNDGDVSGHHTGDYHPNTHWNHDAWILKLDSSGSLLWQKCYGGSKDESAYQLKQTADGGFVFVGSTESVDGDISGKHGGDNDSADVWVVKLSLTGTIEWQKCLGGTRIDEGYSIFQTPDHGYAVLGRTESNNGDVSGNHGAYDVWVLKLSTLANAVESSPGGKSISIFPNPSTDEMHLNLNNLFPVNVIHFYNLLGLEFYPDYHIENSSATVDVHNLPTGSYIVRISYGDEGQPNMEEVQKFMHYRN